MFGSGRNKELREARAHAMECNLMLRMGLRRLEHKARREGDTALASRMRDQRRRALSQRKAIDRATDPAVMRDAADDWQGALSAAMWEAGEI